jgi:hypothetical protein
MMALDSSPDIVCERARAKGKNWECGCERKLKQRQATQLSSDLEDGPSWRVACFDAPLGALCSVWSPYISTTAENCMLTMTYDFEVNGKLHSLFLKNRHYLD